MVDVWFIVPFIAVMLVMVVMNADEEQAETVPVVMLLVAESPMVSDVDVAIASTSVPAEAVVVDFCPPLLPFAAIAVVIELDASVEEVIVAVPSEDALPQGMLTP